MTKDDVAWTALFVAAVRAREATRPSPLFRDGLSAVLAGREGLAWLAKSDSDPSSNYRLGSFPYLEVRTRFFDDWLLNSVREARATQVVLLGAGMDTRAFRLTWPQDLELYEIDSPELFSIKERRLQSVGASPSCGRVVVTSDLTSKGWTRRVVDAGLSKDLPTTWLAEGLFQYLTASQVRGILSSAASVSPRGSRLGAEVISKRYFSSASNRRRLQRRRLRGASWKFGIDDPVPFFRAEGWEIDETVRAVDAAIALGRWTPTGDGRVRGPPPASFVSSVRLP